MNPPEAKIFDKIGYVVTTAVVVFLAIALFGCGSRQKIITKTNETAQIEKTTDSVFTKNEVSITDQTAAIKTIENETGELFEFDGNQGDTLSIEKFGNDGKLISKTRISGKGKAKIGTVKKETNSKVSASTEKATATIENLAVKTSEVTNKETSNYNKQVKSTGVGFFNWLWIIIVLIIVLILWYVNKRLKIL